MSPRANSRPSTALQRLLRRLLTRGRGDARAMEEAIHLASVLRLLLLFVLSIALPASLLAYFAVRSARVEEALVVNDLSREGAVVADTFWAQVDRDFTAFEQRVGDRLRSGRSPLEAPGELHPHLRVALRFDHEGRLRAPFVVADEGGTPEEEDLFHPAVRAAEQAEAAKASPETLIPLYQRIAAEHRSAAMRGRAQLDEARLRQRLDQEREAVALLDGIITRAELGRDAWGLRITDQARLLKAAWLVQRDPEAGSRALRTVVEDLLAERWTVDAGGEAALANHALSMVPQGPSGDWAAVARGRVAERSNMLYWTGELLPELDPVFGATPGRLPDGVVRWELGGRALWATTWWGDDYYAFGLDLDTVLSELKADARAAVVADSDVSAWLVSPNEKPPADALTSKSLGPWLGGWTLVVALRDPEGLEADRISRRSLRTGVVGTALLVLIAGSLTTLMLLRRELAVARQQTDFAASVSHELRSPITHIRSQGEALLYGLKETDDEREDAYLSIVRESERLSRLVDNVLDFAAIERGAKRYALRPGDIAETVERAIGSISSAQEVQDKELDVDLPADLPPVAHDADAISQCVINLVSNAAKYSAPNGWIGLRGRIVEGGVEITISDKGIGIAPHDMQRIFEPFFRSSDALARRRKGTGIGLTITRYIMQAHGGDVTVQSRPGQGSSFTLRFPRSPPEVDRRG
jgi:signal transduction histidine kinase